MHPVLIQFGKVSVYTYGFFIAIGFIVGILLAKKESIKQGINPDDIMDLAFYMILSAVIGSRLFYVMTTPETFLDDPLSIFKIWNGGLVFYGGFILCMVTFFTYVKIKQLDVWKTADICAPSIAIGQFFGRLGCFSAGCCFGKVCDLPWAVTFSNPDSLAPTGIPLHPSQLYHALGNLFIFVVIFSFRNHKRYQGQLFWTYVVLYGAVRSILEMFRGDFRGSIFFNLFSVSQMIGGTMVITGLAMLIILGRKKNNYVRS